MVNVSSGEIDSAFTFTANLYQTPRQDLSSTFNNNSENSDGIYNETANAVQMRLGFPQSNDSSSFVLGYTLFYNGSNNSKNPFPEEYPRFPFFSINAEFLKIPKRQIPSIDVVKSTTLSWYRSDIERIVTPRVYVDLRESSYSNISFNVTRQYILKKTFSELPISLLFSPGGTVEFGKRPYFSFHYWSGFLIKQRHYDLIGGIMQTMLFGDGAFPINDIYQNRKPPVHRFISLKYHK